MISLESENLAINENYITLCKRIAPMFKRYSSRRRPLDTGLLTPQLTGARSYDRIAGYFFSSLLEVVSETLITILRFLAAIDAGHRSEGTVSTRLVAGVGAEENDHV